MIKNLAFLFGAVFLLVGVLGFVSATAPVHSDGIRYLLGLFMVGTIHDIIHLLSGAVAILGGLKSEKCAQLYFRAFGSVYALVAVIGFIQKTTVFHIFMVNKADNFLNLVVAVILLAIGFGVEVGTGTTVKKSVVV